MADQTVGQRISQLISHLGISKNAFAASLDKTATVIQHLVDERNKPGFDLLCKIFEVYPNVSKDWLLQGNGSMLTGSESAAPKEVPAPEINEEQPVAPASKPAEPAVAPVIPAPAAAPSENIIPPSAPAPIAEVPVAPAVAAPVATLPVPPIPTPAPAAPLVDPTASLQAALYAQQLTHQLALAEMRNQHLQEQQRMMQQMMEMMQRQLSR